MVSLDASFCIDALNGTGAANAKERELEASGARLCISVPAAMEVLVWGRRHGETAWKKTSELIDRLEVLDANLEVAQETSRLWLECEKRGATVPAIDLLIAATARVYHQSLVTRDSDFHRVAGLTIESY